MTCLLVDGTAMLRWDVQDLHQSRRQIRHQDRKCWQFACISATVNDVTEFVERLCSFKTHTHTHTFTCSLTCRGLRNNERWKELVSLALIKHVVQAHISSIRLVFS
ncbi:uncharacterized protein [Physcomitrium patens]|uniref:Uncharacterized protein n=1 Tax=Physcomitrium patens TaxID=3218 RepID=A0A2K1IH00_PHYPA|nr:uncharacterized protein LOC112276574 [Physcomitrium patens]PNR28550.1 hypothetical protein PHYPA_029142 [Physcomitrium patens]|eukprot:XP_024363754.1 uncharacterized protein LOC112276574 [Physcomitrella patens]